MPEDTYVELHHICPKADDLFPEYADLSIHVWNGIYLTARQHIIAHIMLWKAYGGSQSHAVSFMFDGDSESNWCLSQRVIPNHFKSRYAAKAKIEARARLDAKNRIFWTGRARYALPDGTYYAALKHDDPLIKEMGLIKYSSDKQWQQRETRIELATEAKLG